jgi:hypothetical protein
MAAARHLRISCLQLDLLLALAHCSLLAVPVFPGQAALTNGTPRPSIVRASNELSAWRILSDPAVAVHSKGSAALA